MCDLNNKQVLMIGRGGRAAWSFFTPCQTTLSLLEAVARAARSATSGDLGLLSPACSGFDQFRDYQERGEIFCRAVKSIGRGALAGTPYIHDKTVTTKHAPQVRQEI